MQVDIYCANCALDTMVIVFVLDGLTSLAHRNALGRSTRFSHYQVCRQIETYGFHDPGRWERLHMLCLGNRELRVYKREQEFNGSLAHLITRLPHRCERWPHMSRERNVIETDYRNIFRDTYSVLFGNRQDTERHLIIPDENGAGPLIRTHREDGVCTNSPARISKLPCSTSSGSGTSPWSSKA